MKCIERGLGRTVYVVRRYRIVHEIVRDLKYVPIFSISGAAAITMMLWLMGVLV